MKKINLNTLFFLVNFVLAFFLWIKFVLSSIKIIFLKYWNHVFLDKYFVVLVKSSKTFKVFKRQFLPFPNWDHKWFFFYCRGGGARKIPSLACCFLLPLNPSHQSMWSFYLSDLDMVHRRENHAVHHSDIHQPRSIQSCSTSLWYTPT